MSDQTTPGGRTPQRILVADDDPIVLRFLEALLSDAGYEVCTAGDGEEALQKIREEKPDMVILDLVMPYRDGFDICRTVRQSPSTRTLPIIVLSMKDKESDIIRCFEAGADEFVRKPFNALELIARIRKILDRRSPSA
jgi:two-component system alkaline phosphatase synthesis response regulator PhoP